MSTVKKLGHSEFGSRDLYALDLRHFEIPSGVFQDITGNFIACLAMDGAEATDDEIKTIALDLIQAGCAYICCWGPDCERVHGLIDEYRIYLHPVVLGHGRPFFAGPRPPLRLMTYDLICEDVIRLTYVPA